MSHAKSDEEIMKRKYNVSRFFVEQRHISWVMLMLSVSGVSTAIGVCLSAKTLTRRSKVQSPSGLAWSKKAKRSSN